MAAVGSRAGDASYRAVASKRWLQRPASEVLIAPSKGRRPRAGISSTLRVPAECSAREHSAGKYPSPAAPVHPLVLEKRLPSQQALEPASARSARLLSSSARAATGASAIAVKRMPLRDGASRVVRRKSATRRPPRARRAGLAGRSAPGSGEKLP